ncbi:L-threonylcarbamoyladenylate synthase [Micromonospora peucetia]|uniref:L-threonylcarbamoyladenylate synthase n=1 Tax=Micromonospora peucetia TaxID=47871 RepID=A0ABZ1EJ29_9ACTN|nr:Sua5/YciO/YrdC/YwlC family protein [Micromonospora peucetia]WSA34252.1 Sua5/YciO/YrdC/YwlC family protein [Micromonospora peucetia]
MKLIRPDELPLAIEALEAGELVVVPTRRWYMICANARDHDACARIYAGKGRPRSKSLAYILPSPDAADELFVMTLAAIQLASVFWPGDLAMVLRWRGSERARQHQPVGVPNALVNLDPGPLGQIARQSSVPVAATTANFSDPTSTFGPAITATEVESFVAKSEISVAYCIDGGISPLANHLTIVDCTETQAKIARSGVVHARAVDAALAAVSQSQPHAKK